MIFPQTATASMCRLIEECAEELGRLDALVSVTPPAVATALQMAAIARLGRADAQATRLACAALVSARVELVHAAALDETLAHWRDRAEEGERRARSGAVLALPHGVAQSGEADRAVNEALRPGSELRPLLLRALTVAAWLPENESDAELLAGLVLVAGGLTDRLRVLPFAEWRGAARREAAAAWRAGDAEPFTRGALGALAATARQLRVQVRLLMDAQPDEDAHLGAIGRAAVTARQALAELRLTLATSVPELSQRLDLSRPAAGAALERLVTLGLAEEITGRARDRVFVLSAAWALV